MMWDGGFSSGGWIFGWVMMIVVVVLIAAGIVLLVRASSGQQGGGSAKGGEQGSSGQSEGSGSAMRILEERYARGEIDQDEFLRRKKDLTGK